MEVKPRGKYAVIYRHRNEYPISVMCRFFQISRSGYYDFVHRLGRPEKDAALTEMIAEQRERSFRTYGYRRMWLVLKKRGIHRNPKTILRIMEKYGLLAEIRRRLRRLNRYNKHMAQKIVCDEFALLIGQRRERQPALLQAFPFVGYLSKIRV